MSQENVVVVRASLAAWSAGRLDAFRDLHDPNVTILRFIEDWPEPAPVAGRDAVVDFYDGVRTGDDASAEPITEFREAAATVAIRVLWRTSSQGHDMGMEVTVVYTVRSGRDCGHRVLPGSRRSPRSRGALGVGDVAGERGAG